MHRIIAFKTVQLDVKWYAFSWKETVKIIDFFSYFLQKRKQFSSVLTFLEYPKAKWWVIAVCEHALQSLHSKRYDLMLNVRFLVERRLLKLIDSFSFRPKQSQWPHSWVILSNYARALLYSDLKRNRYKIVCRNRYDYCNQCCIVSFWK